MTDAISLMLVDLEARVAELQRFRDHLLATLGETAAGRDPASAPAPVPAAPPGADPPAPAPAPRVRAPYKNRSQYLPRIVGALRGGPLTPAEIAVAIGAQMMLWYEVFKKCPWFERSDPLARAGKGRPARWQLSAEGRLALANQ